MEAPLLSHATGLK